LLEDELAPLEALDPPLELLHALNTSAPAVTNTANAASRRCLAIKIDSLLL
jgi:hypothetical protein